MAEPFSVAYSKYRTKNFSDVTLSLVDKKLIASLVIKKMSTVSELVRRFRLNERMVQRYVKAVRDGKAIRSIPGKPRKVDDIGLETIKTQLIERREKDNAVTSAEFKQIVVEEAVKSNIRAGGSDLSQTLSKSCLRAVKEDLDLAETAGQRKTSARIVAEGDPRNAYCEALLFGAFQTGIRSNLF